ncbi:MAG: nitroreductase family protein [Chloroflexi bacterium]|nr:nitroreductase family protein [Chloroflexota bacterium]
MDTLEAIKNRRSIRQQKSDPIDEATLNKVLEAARWAPSWANVQAWRFVVVRDQNIKAQLDATRGRRPPPPPAPGATPPPPPSAVITAPVTIVVCGELKKAGVRPDGTPSTDKGDSWYMYDAGLATQNLCLAAHALGLGTVILGAFDARKVAEILQVPEGFAPVVMVPLGAPSAPGRPTTRKELSEIVFYDKFGAK